VWLGLIVLPWQVKSLEDALKAAAKDPEEVRPSHEILRAGRGITNLGGVLVCRMTIPGIWGTSSCLLMAESLTEGEQGEAA
jgi:hypothetical protein